MKKLVSIALLLGILAGCTSQSSKPSEAEKPKPKPPELATGRTAFQKLYAAAHGWARDAQPYRLESQVTADGNGRDGRATIWRGWFASVLQRGVKPYVWSGSDSPDSERGITPGTEDNYNPANSSTAVFDVAYLKVDSDQALQVAQKHGGEKLLAKNPDTPIFYVLDWSRATNELIWHVIYGSSRNEAKLAVAVNASSGEFIRLEK
jgi:hypothetical protein